MINVLVKETTTQIPCRGMEKTLADKFNKLY